VGASENFASAIDPSGCADAENDDDAGVATALADDARTDARMRCAGVVFGDAGVRAGDEREETVVGGGLACRRADRSTLASGGEDLDEDALAL
jgi:hypothetical protein